MGMKEDVYHIMFVLHEDKNLRFVSDFWSLCVSKSRNIEIVMPHQALHTYMICMNIQIN